MKKRIISFFLAVCMALSLGSAAGAESLKKTVEGSAAYLLKTVTEPTLASIGGEWAILGLSRSGCELPEGYLEGYVQQVEKAVKDCGGVLHQKKYTEYSRVIIGLTAAGKDPTNVGGYDLLLPLGDYEKTVWQGINGPIWALIALDSGNYAIPKNSSAAVQASRQRYVDAILKDQLANGGWTLGGKGGSDSAADPDMTAMALQALANYQEEGKVKAAIEKALDCLSKLQDENGGYASWGTTNSESVVQVIVALCQLGIDLNDARFVKNGSGLLKNLLSFRLSDGSFVHVKDGNTGSNQLATEQGFYGIVSALRASEGKSSLYRINEPLFSDIENSAYRRAIERLTANQIIGGMGDGSFRPADNMTRAQFCSIIVKALGLRQEEGSEFSDVDTKKWYAPYIAAAGKSGIVNGVGDGKFNPEGTITRQEAAVMVTRAAALCGMENNVSDAQSAKLMKQYTDSTKADGWAKKALAFCSSEELFEFGQSLQPKAAIHRDEIAQMLYELLLRTNRL